jgi:GT2 family glycosyltransferase
MTVPLRRVPTEPRASVVVLNYNGRPHLDVCLPALMAQECDGGLEVVLVDNGSEDGSSEYVRANWPEVNVIEAGKNLGFAAGNNLGISSARGHYIVLLNNDTRVRPGWLSGLIVAAESDPAIGAVTSKLVFMDRPCVIQNAGSLVLSDGSGGDRGTGEEDKGQYDQREEVFAACGAAVLLNPTMLQDVGLFDSRFFAYYEDTDLSWRMRLRGWKVVYEPAAVVEHMHSGTSVEWSPFFTFHVDRNRLFMILKNAPLGFLARSLAQFGRRSTWSLVRGRLEPGQRAGAGAAEHSSVRRIGVRTHLRVALSLLARLPEMVVKRWRIRHRRRVNDAEILQWFHSRELWDAHMRAH